MTILRAEQFRTTVAHPYEVRVVLAHGCFDVLHPGHVKHLQEAAEQGDVLVVGVTADEYVPKGPGRPVFSQWDRMMHLDALKCVDYVVLDEGHGEDLIQIIKPDVFVKGADMVTSLPPVIQRLAEQQGIKVHFTGSEMDSTTRVAARAFKTYDDTTEEWLEEFRKNYSADEVLSALDSIKDVRVLVTGDYGESTLRYVEILPAPPGEGAIPWTRLVREEVMPDAMDAIFAHLREFTYNPMLVQPPSFRGHLFLDVDTRRELFYVQEVEPYSDEDKRRYTENLEGAIGDYDVVIVADYGHGAIGDSVKELLERREKFVAATAKSYPGNYPHHTIRSYRDLDYGVVNGQEYDLGMAQQPGLWPKDLMLTRGAKGSSNGFDTPSFAVDIVDTIGAGDAILAVTAPMVFRGVNREIVGFVGQAVAAMQCQIHFNEKPVDPAVLRKFIARLLS